MITSEQIRAARALLRLDQGEVARRARISPATLRRLEAPHGETAVGATVLATVEHVLVQAGARFSHVGVRPAGADPDADPGLVADLLAIADSSAARPVLDPHFDESALYGRDGLPG